LPGTTRAITLSTAARSPGCKHDDEVIEEQVARGGGGVSDQDFSAGRAGGLPTLVRNVNSWTSYGPALGDGSPIGRHDHYGLNFTIRAVAAKSLPGGAYPAGYRLFDQEAVFRNTVQDPWDL